MAQCSACKLNIDGVNAPLNTSTPTYVTSMSLTASPNANMQALGFTTPIFLGTVDFAITSGANGGCSSSLPCTTVTNCHGNLHTRLNTIPANIEAIHGAGANYNVTVFYEKDGLYQGFGNSATAAAPVSAYSPYFTFNQACGQEGVSIDIRTISSQLVIAGVSGGGGSAATYDVSSSADPSVISCSDCHAN